MSWKRVLNIIDARIGLCSYTDSGPLQYWRNTIGKAYADFQVGFSGCGPSLLVSLAFGVDGRTEDSNFPNFFIPAERERYGV